MSIELGAWNWQDLLPIPNELMATLQELSVGMAVESVT